MFACVCSQAQTSFRIYDSDLLPAAFHKKRREALRQLMPENSVAFIFSLPVKKRSNDVFYEYQQNPNLYYLTGYKEPHSVLVLFKEYQNFDSIQTNEILFVQPSDSLTELWNGKRIGEQNARKILEIEHVYPNYTFPDFHLDFSRFSEILYDIPEESCTDDPNDRGDLYSLIKHFKLKADTLLQFHSYLYFKDLMAQLREVKTNEELTLLINAIDYTCEGIRELMAVLKPGMHEYEVEAVVEYIFKKNGAEYPGFPSICGGGENSCILHYTDNRKQLKEGELVVVDVGAEYHGYTADVTRTLPVSGKFSEPQKAIYELVLKAQQKGIEACVPGNKFWDPGRIAKDIIARGLLELGIIKEYGEVTRYFMHGTSHYLGLDVHDVGTYTELKPGNVITVEPGIYIPEGSPCDPKWWNIGIRIEDDVLITDHSPEVLSNCVPKTPEMIEVFMKKHAVYLKE